MAVTGPIPLPGNAMDALMNSAINMRNLINSTQANNRLNKLFPGRLQQQQLQNQTAQENLTEAQKMFPGKYQGQQLQNQTGQEQLNELKKMFGGKLQGQQTQQQMNELQLQQAQRQNVLEKFKQQQALKALAAKGYDISKLGGGAQFTNQGIPIQSSTVQPENSGISSAQQNSLPYSPIPNSSVQTPGMVSQMSGGQNQPGSQVPTSNEIEISPSVPALAGQEVLTPPKPEIKGNFIQRTYGDGRITLTPLPASGISSQTGKEISDLEVIKKKYGENSPQYILALKGVNAKIKGEEALANARLNPNRYLPAQAKNLNALYDQLKKEFPNYSDDQLGKLSDALISGQDNIDGNPLPDVSTRDQILANAVNKTASTAAIQNSAANLNNTVSEFEKVDLAPLKEFTGVGGTAKFLAQQATPSTRTDAWYKYDAFKNSIRIIAMDTLRKGFATSVVPDYVYATLGKLANPVDPIWGDPKQVETRWNTTLGMLRTSAKNTTKQAKLGASTSLEKGSPEENNAPEQKQYSKSGREIKNVNGKWMYVNGSK